MGRAPSHAQVSPLGVEEERGERIKAPNPHLLCPKQSSFINDHLSSNRTRRLQIIIIKKIKKIQQKQHQRAGKIQEG